MALAACTCTVIDRPGLQCCDISGLVIALGNCGTLDASADLQLSRPLQSMVAQLLARVLTDAVPLLAAPAGVCTADIEAGQGMVVQGRNTFKGLDCPVNTYGVAGRVYGWAAAPCKPCPRNMVTNVAGATSIDACINPGGYGYASEGQSASCVSSSVVGNPAGSRLAAAALTCALGNQHAHRQACCRSAAFVLPVACVHCVSG